MWSSQIYAIKKFLFIFFRGFVYILLAGLDGHLAVPLSGGGGWRQVRGRGLFLHEDAILATRQVLEYNFYKVARFKRLLLST
jgi:hypothetical protein